MEENRLPEFGSMEELVEFLDTHDMCKYQDQMPEAHCDVVIEKRTFLLAVDQNIMVTVQFV